MASRPEDGAGHGRAFTNLGAAADHRIRTDARASFDDRALVNEARTFQDSRTVNARAGRNGFGGRRQVLEGGRRVATVHDVAMDLNVLLGCADVDPIARVDVRDEGLSALDE